jgi:hypothetical protein
MESSLTRNTMAPNMEVNVRLLTGNQHDRRSNDQICLNSTLHSLSQLTVKRQLKVHADVLIGTVIYLHVQRNILLSQVHA